MRKIIFLEVLIGGAILRLWRIGNIPPIVNTTTIAERCLSSFFNIGNSLLVYFYIKNTFKSVKLTQISFLIYLLLPWSIEQGRIYSQVNFALFVFLLIILAAKKIKSRPGKLFFYLSIPISFYFVYPQFWIYKIIQNLHSFNFLSIFKNSLFLLSPEFFFFKNPTFWWGGVRDFGILYLSFLPFLVVGIYKFIADLKWEVVIWFVFILIVASFSPFFPENREFFLSLPFICLIVALGMRSLFSQKGKFAKIILSVLFLLIIYDIASFFHYYIVHYPQQVVTNKEKINEKF